MSESNRVEYKRKDGRETVLTKAEIRIDGDWCSCRILNISTGGAKLQIDRQINRGVAIFLKVGEFGEFSAIAAWQQNDEIGVTFTHDAFEVADMVMGLASYG